MSQAANNKARLCVVGALGRMGQRIVALAGDYDLRISAALVEAGDTHVGQSLHDQFAQIDDDRLLFADQPLEAMQGVDVAIDFALAKGLEQRLDAARQSRCAFVCGSTGISDDQHQALREAAQDIAVLWAPNMSTGVNVLLQLVEQAARMLPDLDVELHELHHRHKADAPSGTAVALARQVAAARGLDDDVLTLNRGAGLRRDDEIGVVANRGGEVVGEHTVYFFGQGERIELVHRAADRDIFVHGALRAARWILGQKPGLYRMADTLKTN